MSTEGKTLFVIYSPPFIADTFSCLGHEDEESARYAFDFIKEQGYVNTTRGHFLVRLDGVDDDLYALLVREPQRGVPFTPPEALREYVLNDFEGFKGLKVTPLADYTDSIEDWHKEALSAHGELPDDVDYQVTR